jgi:protein involved in polysaccharide export with SLBB domain
MSRTLLLCLGAGIVLGSVGCASEKVTISFDEFMALQRGLAPAEPGPVPADPDTGEPRVDTTWAPYRAGPGDALLVTLTGLGVDITPEVRVLVHGDGRINLPIVGKMSVEGLETEEMEDLIHKTYVPSVVRDLAVRVDVQEYDTTEVLVLGTVELPGVVPLPRHQRNMLFAVLAAGGVSPATSGKATLQRIRRPAETVEIDLTMPVELEAALALDPLEDGDIIKVGSAFPNTIFVGGLLNAPAPQTYEPGVRVNFLQAIAAAGGLRTDVTPKEGLLIRRMPDGRDVRVDLDLRRLERGEDENFLLASGDILWIPETFGTKLQDFINRNFFFRAGVSVTYNPISFEQHRRALRQDRRYGSDFAGSINTALRYGLQTAFFPPVTTAQP